MQIVHGKLVCLLPLRLCVIFTQEYVFHMRACVCVYHSVVYLRE